MHLKKVIFAISLTFSFSFVSGSDEKQDTSTDANKELKKAIEDSYEQYPKEIRYQKQREAIAAALDKGADINAEPFLIRAAGKHNLELMKILLSFPGINLYASTNESGFNENVIIALARKWPHFPDFDYHEAIRLLKSSQFDLISYVKCALVFFNIKLVKALIIHNNRNLQNSGLLFTFINGLHNGGFNKGMS